MRCLVTGATGYIGGRLAPRLIEAGHEVRCLTRDPRRLRDVPWADRAEVVSGDLTDPVEARAACEDVDVAYYLAHSMGEPGFEDAERQAASVFAEAAATAGVRRIVFLGGPAPRSANPSPHLRSREAVAQVLLESQVPTVVLRAAVIVGSGSASFEILRHLTERLPVMITPRWVGNRIQPIAVRDVLRYLVEWADVPGEVNRAFEIGGPEVLTYAEMIHRFARVAGHPSRVLLPTSVLSPELSSYLVGLVTPVPNSIARPLVASLIQDAVCEEHDIAEYVPDPPDGLIGFNEAISLALAKIRDFEVETRWANSAWIGTPADPLPTDPDWSGATVYTDERQCVVDAPGRILWRVVEGIGGETGWYSFPLAWSLRGWLDRLVGGVGLRRGRRDPHRLQVGEALDFWRVEEIEPGRLLRLRAEMRLPGRAWLEMSAEPDGSGSRFRQRAVYLPQGSLGHLYWMALVPFHAIIFGGMARNIARAAERAADPDS